MAKLRDTSREVVGISLSQAIPNTSEAEKKRLEQLGHDFAAFHQQGSAWETAKWETCAEILEIASKKKDADNLSEAFNGLPHIDKPHIKEGLREYLMNRK